MARQSRLPFPALISAFWFSIQTIKTRALSSEGSNLEEEPTFPTSTPRPPPSAFGFERRQWSVGPEFSNQWHACQLCGKLARQTPKSEGSGPLSCSVTFTSGLAPILQPCLTLCDPGDCGPPGSSVHGILQARILQWVAISSSRRSSPSRD